MYINYSPPPNLPHQGGGIKKTPLSMEKNNTCSNKVPYQREGTICVPIRGEFMNFESPPTFYPDVWRKWDNVSLAPEQKGKS